MIFVNTKNVYTFMITMLTCANMSASYKEAKQFEKACEGLSLSMKELCALMSESNMRTIESEELQRATECLSGLQQKALAALDAQDGAANELIRLKLIKIYSPSHMRYYSGLCGFPTNLPKEKQALINAIVDDYAVQHGRRSSQNAKAIDSAVMDQVKRKESNIALQLWKTLSCEDHQPSTVKTIAARMFLQHSIRELYKHRLVVEQESGEEKKFGDLTWHIPQFLIGNESEAYDIVQCANRLKALKANDKY